MEVIIIDPRLAGASGDMLLASIVDLVGEKHLLEFIEQLNEYFKTGISININRIKKKGLNSIYLELAINRDIPYNHVVDLKRELNGFLEYLPISSVAKSKIKETFQLIFKAESIVHNEPLETLHLHETASIDTFLDIVGFYYLLEKNNLLHVPFLCLPINTGSGFVEFSHGKVSVPAPAVSEIARAKRLLVFSDQTEGELLTPTGIAIIASVITKQIEVLPPIIIKKIARGAGTKNLKNKANVLTLFYSDIPEDESKHCLSVLETHVDDVSGEILGSIVSLLLEKGALDVSYYPLVMKKNRPAWNLRIICEKEKASELAHFVMLELGTLGVRETIVTRYELERQITVKKVEIKGKTFECRFKERMIKGEIVGAKPEYEDIKRISQETEIPLIDLEKQLIKQYYSE
ncbi:MAG: nickel pincer cofactor biosynthesis protein LarC [Candidatus Heimdallarchaeum endolithica]|uniref:Nickel pincer cofactor biosynthesis protein LarC n=1 Tax=Candidatus Heimdallarchaeum endolithica TaxID=2876572 RepID=A0A9Y1FPQ4_9ARCH|nr:MAG: nickel pincer cofactor biosynthesis protein LarC [Candidatus Heimdallarchaeum endolithica]